MEYQIVLSADEINYVLKVLSQRPYEECFKVLSKIQSEAKLLTKDDIAQSIMED